MNDARTDHHPPASDWLTVKEFAALRRVHHQTVRLWIRLGVVKAERDRPRGRWLIRRPRFSK